MTRGIPDPIGTKRVTQNGYPQTRTEDGWRYDHHIIAEEKLGRPIAKDERVVFEDGDRNNLDPSNISVKKKFYGSTNAKRARLEARIAELQLQLEELED